MVGAVEEWMHTVAGLDQDCLVWVLFFTDHPSRVTFNKSSDYGSERGAVERYAAQLGLEAFDSYGGFKKLLRAKVEVGNLVGPAIMDDKSDDAIKFTPKVGRKLFSILRSNPEFRRLLLDALGVEAGGEDGWFPFKVSTDAAIAMAGREPVRQGEGITSFLVSASLDCAKCGQRFSHEYPATWPMDQWMTVQAPCDRCGHDNTHYMVGPDSAPW